MAKPATVKIRLVSTADTGFFYVTKKNPRNTTEKMVSTSTIPSCASTSSSRKPRSSKVHCEFNGRPSEQAERHEPMKLPLRSIAGAAVSAALVVSLLRRTDRAQSRAGPSPATLARPSPRCAAYPRCAPISSRPTAMASALTRRADAQAARAIRFQYEKGVPMLIVSDGRALTFVDYGVRQVQRWPITQQPAWRAARSQSRCDALRHPGASRTAIPNVVSVEVRDKGHPEYGVITLVFIRKASAPGGLELASWAALDSQNKRTTSPCRITSTAWPWPTVRLSLERSAPGQAFVDDSGNGSSRNVPDLRQFATFRPVRLFTWQQAKCPKY
jgi:hypothetical protein